MYNNNAPKDSSHPKKIIIIRQKTVSQSQGIHLPGCAHVLKTIRTGEVTNKKQKKNKELDNSPSACVGIYACANIITQSACKMHLSPPPGPTWGLSPQHMLHVVCALVTGMLHC